MSNPKPYLYQGNYYCDGDIVSVLTSNQPWADWVVRGNTPGDRPVEEELTEIARQFHINRLRRDSTEFPVAVVGLPVPPSFCGVCMTWFYPEEKEA